MSEGSAYSRLVELTLLSEPLAAFVKTDHRGHDCEPLWQPQRREWAWVRCRIKEICVGGVRPRAGGGGPSWRLWRVYRREQRSDGAPRGLFSSECLWKKHDIGQGEWRNLSKVSPETDRRVGPWPHGRDKKAEILDSARAMPTFVGLLTPDMFS